MLIEEILPINYYNQMIGVLVDTEIIKIIIQQLMPKLSKIIRNNKDYEGHFIGDLFINKILANLFTSKTIDKNISLLIFDYLFLKGNKVLFQSLLSIYSFLSNTIMKGEKSIEHFNYIINEELKKLTIDNEDFLYNLFFHFENSISHLNIDEIRNSLCIKLCKTLEEKNFEYVKSKLKLFYNSELLQKQEDNLKKCKAEWPYCLGDTYFENVSRIVEFICLNKRDNNYIDDYFFYENGKNKNINKAKEKKDKKLYNLLLERRPHFCNQIQDEIKIQKDNEKPKEIDKIKTIDDTINDEDKKSENIEEEEIAEEENNINKIEFIRNAITTENLANISQIIEENIITNDNENNIEKTNV